MDVGSIAICMAIGALIVFASIGIGVCFGRCDKGQSDGDSCVHSSATVGSGNRSRNNGCDKQVEAEEVVERLQNLRVALSGQERNDLDYACECILRIGKIQDYIDNHSDES